MNERMKGRQKEGKVTPGGGQIDDAIAFPGSPERLSSGVSHDPALLDIGS